MAIGLPCATVLDSEALDLQRWLFWHVLSKQKFLAPAPNGTVTWPAFNCLPSQQADIRRALPDIGRLLSVATQP